MNRATPNAPSMRVRLQITEAMIIRGTSHSLLEHTLAKKWNLGPRQIRKYIRKVYDQWDQRARTMDDGEKNNERRMIRYSMLEVLRLSFEDRKEDGTAKEPNLKLAGIMTERLAKLSGLLVDRLKIDPPGPQLDPMDEAKQELARRVAKRLKEDQ